VQALQTLHLPTYQRAVLEWITGIGGAGVSHHPHLLDAETKLRTERGTGAAADGLAQI
jgi:hypothetical protein